MEDFVASRKMSAINQNPKAMTNFSKGAQMSDLMKIDSVVLNLLFADRHGEANNFNRRSKSRHYIKFPVLMTVSLLNLPLPRDVRRLNVS